MTHDDFRMLIQLELDEELSAKEAELLEEHVATCADCRLERADYQKLLAGFAVRSELRPERSFVDQMIPDLANFTTKAPPAPVAKPMPMPMPRRAYRWRALSAAAAVVLVVLAATQWSSLFGGHRGTDVRLADNQPTTQQPGQDQAGHPNSGTPGTPATGSTGSKQTDSTSTNNLGTATEQTAPSPSAVQTPPLILADAGPTGTKTLKQSITQPPVTSSTPTGSTQTGSTKTNTSQTGSNKSTFTSGPEQLQPSGQPIGTHLVGGGGGISGGIPTQSGLFGIVPLNIVGPVLNPPADLNALLQVSVQGGLDAWATDPIQVVERNLSALGFSQTAVVAATPDANRVQVTQGGTEFFVTLTQPFAQGPAGIWVPVQISRTLDLNSPVPSDQPIVQYFNEQKATGAILGVKRLEMLQNANGQVTVQATLVPKNAAAGSAAVTKTYLFSIALDLNGSYHLNGMPQVQ